MLFYGVIFAAETQTYPAVKEWLLREELRDERFAYLSSCKAHIIKTLHKRSLMNRMLMCMGKVTQYFIANTRLQSIKYQVSSTHC